MAYSYEQTTAVGGYRLVNIPFPYLDKPHVALYLDGVLQTDFVWNTDQQIEASGPIPGGTSVLVVRTTPIDSPLAVFNRGGFDPDDLNRVVLQLLYREQEDMDAEARAVLVPHGGTIGELPSAEDRAGKFFAFDSEGDPVALPGTPFVADVSGQIASEAQTTAGVLNTVLITPLRLAQRLTSLVSGLAVTRAIAETATSLTGFLSPLRAWQQADAREGSIVNPGGYDWSPVTRPPGGLTTASTTIVRGNGPTGWYGGAGPGGQYRVSTPRLAKGVVPGDPDYCLRLEWTSSPTSGNAIDYPTAPTWATYWEQFDVMDPQVGMGKTFTRRLVVRDKNTFYGTPTRMRPIYWYSAGGLIFAPSMVVYEGEVFQYNNYAFRVWTGGTLDSSNPVIPANQAAASIVPHGSDGATILCLGPTKGNLYEIYEAADVPGNVKVATGEPNAGSLCSFATGDTWHEFVRTVTLPEIGTTDLVSYASTDWPSRTLVEPQRRSARPYFGSGLDLDIVDRAPHLEFFDFDAFGTTAPVYRKAASGLGMWLESLRASYPAHWLQRFIHEVFISGLSQGGVTFAANAGGITSQVGRGMTVARTGVGLYSVTFHAPRLNAHYRAIGGSHNDGVNNYKVATASFTSTGFGLVVLNTAGALVDPGLACVEVFDL